MFSIKSLPDDLITEMIQTKVWRPECPMALNDLSLIELKHYDFNQQIQIGQMVTANIIAHQTVNIFKELYKLKFPIHKITPINYYGGNDELSMEDNNSSCFNFRVIAGSLRVSKHAVGLAIDLNPLQNPYIQLNQQTTNVLVQPNKGINFLNRYNLRPGMVENIVDIFSAYDLKIWGGSWNDPIDYHHFQVDDDFLKKNHLIHLFEST